MVHLKYILDSDFDENNINVYMINIDSDAQLNTLNNIISKNNGFDECLLNDDFVINQDNKWIKLNNPIDNSHLNHYLKENDELKVKDVSSDIFDKIYIVTGLVKEICRIEEEFSVAQRVSDVVEPNFRLGPRVEEWDDWDDPI